MTKQSSCIQSSRIQYQIKYFLNPLCPDLYFDPHQIVLTRWYQAAEYTSGEKQQDLCSLRIYENAEKHPITLLQNLGRKKICHFIRIRTNSKCGLFSAVRGNLFSSFCVTLMTNKPTNHHDGGKDK